MSSAENRFIKVYAPVGGQEKHSLIILKLSEENRDQAIMTIMELGSTRHKRIRFVQKKNGIEMLCNFEDEFKL